MNSLLTTRRKALGLALSWAATSTLAGMRADAFAAAFPDRPIRLVVPFPPGGGTDVIGRYFAQALGEELKTTVIVDNVPGATGTLGTARVARASPDGYTLLLGISATHAIAPAVFKELSYDPVADFVPIGRIAQGGNLLAANLTFPANTAADLIAMARKPDSHIMVGSWGNGSGGHLAMEGINQSAHVHLEHVPYRGVGPVLQDLISGQIQVAMVDVSSAEPMVRAGRIKALATTGPHRSSAFPDVATLKEQGVAFDTASWYAIFAPARTPTPIVDRLSRALDTVLRRPATGERVRSLGMEADPVSNAVFTQDMKSDIVTWAQLVKAGDIHLD